MGDEAPDRRLGVRIWTPAAVGDCIQIRGSVDRLARGRRLPGSGWRRPGSGRSSSGRHLPHRLGRAGQQGARAEQFHPLGQRDRLGPVGCFDPGAKVQAPSAAQRATLWSAQPADFVSALTSLRPGTVISPPASPQVRGVASRGSVSSQAGALAARNTTIGRYGCMMGRIASAAWDAISFARRGPMRSSQPANGAWPRR